MWLVFLSLAVVSATSDYQPLERLENLLTIRANGQGQILEDFLPRRVRGRSSGPIPNQLATLNYACFCANLKNFENGTIHWGNNLGRPLDELDAVCQNLINGWTCLRSAGNPVDVHYDQPNLMGLATVQETNDECDRLNGAGTPLAELCKVEFRFTIKYIQVITLNGNGFLNNVAMRMTDTEREDLCHPYRGNAMGGGSPAGNANKRVCCDTEPYPFKKVLWTDDSNCM